MTSSYSEVVGYVYHGGSIRSSLFDSFENLQTTAAGVLILIQVAGRFLNIRSSMNQKIQGVRKRL
jgi:hypothetical protein